MAVVDVVGAGLGTWLALHRGSGFVRRVFLVIVAALILKTGYDAFFRPPVTISSASLQPASERGLQPEHPAE